MVVGSLSQADRAELRQRANGLRFAFANQFHASHERGADGSHSRQEDSQFSFWRRDLCWLFHSAPLFSSDFTADDARGLEKTHTNKLVVLRTPKRRCKSHHEFGRTTSESRQNSDKVLVGFSFLI